MDAIKDILPTLLGASPQVLALILGLAAIGLAAFSVYVVHSAFRGRGRR